MPAIQSLVLTDRTTPTPVNYTFVPNSVAEATGFYTLEVANSVPLGRPKFKIGTRRANGRLRTTIKLVVPVVQTEVINGISTPKIVRTAFVDVQFTFDENSSEQERNAVVGMFYSGFAASKVRTNDVLVKG